MRQSLQLCCRGCFVFKLLQEISFYQIQVWG